MNSSRDPCNQIAEYTATLLAYFNVTIRGVFPLGFSGRAIIVRRKKYPSWRILFFFFFSLVTARRVQTSTRELTVHCSAFYALFQACFVRSLLSSSCHSMGMRRNIPERGGGPTRLPAASKIIRGSQAPHLEARAVNSRV